MIEERLLEQTKSKNKGPKIFERKSKKGTMNKSKVNVVVVEDHKSKRNSNASSRKVLNLP